MKEVVRFAVIGCGLMGKEFASAAARWCHISEDIPRPEIVAVANRSEEPRKWFEKNVPTVRYSVSDYRELLGKDDIDAVYCAVPHVSHEQIYVDVIESGKHLLGEKPFGMDKEQNARIMEAINAHTEVFVRCFSQFPYYPACQELIRWTREGRLGRIIEIKAGFLHSSDLDLNKPINWKRQVKYNGEYGCMGDLGPHVLFVPLRLGFMPKRVYAQLSNIVTERPEGQGGMAACDTWDNASLLCSVEGDVGEIPMHLDIKRIAPGSTNDWYIEIYGIDASVKYSTSNPSIFNYSVAKGKEQPWSCIDIGYNTMIGTISGRNFHFGFSDAILQMWATFLAELFDKDVSFGCFTPRETMQTHAVLTAALKSQQTEAAVEVQY